MPVFVKIEREHGSLIAGLQKASRSSTDGSIFTTLKSGLQMLIDRMVATLPRPAFDWAAQLTEVTRSDEKWRVSALSEASKFDAVVIATPADVTRRLLEPLDPAFDELLTMDASSAHRGRLGARSGDREILADTAWIRISCTSDFAARSGTAASCLYFCRPEIPTSRSRRCGFTAGLLWRR